MTQRFQIKTSIDLGYTPIGTGVFGSPTNPYDPTDAAWDSVGDQVRLTDGRLATLQRKGITLAWGPISAEHCDVLMTKYLELASVGFRLYGIIVPPRRGNALGTWQAYTGFPVGDQLIWVDEPTYTYSGPIVEDFRWHFANVTDLAGTV